MSIIFHITKRDEWDKARAPGSYQTESLESQGYIHCSKPDQLISVANFLFRNQTDLVLLCIDKPKVEAEIRDENLEGGDKLFPHIYGLLNIDAVIEVIDFKPQTDGSFELPQKAICLISARDISGELDTAVTN